MMGFGTSRYKKVYDEGLRKGFLVNKIVSYSVDGSEQARVIMTTPFTRDGDAVSGSAMVKLEHVGRDEIRDFHSCAFHVNGHNVFKSDSVIFKIGDKEYSYDKAVELMGQFAAASTEYPHVMTEEEYHLFIGKDADYVEYLDTCISEMKDGREYIGAVTDVSQVE